MILVALTARPITYSRSKSMLKRKILPALIASSLFSISSVSNAGLWESTKETVNSAIPWKQKHLDELSFEERGFK